MENRRGDKIVEIEEYLEKFGSIIPNDFDEYIEDFMRKAACERYFEKIVEAVIDVGEIGGAPKHCTIPSFDAI